MEARCYRHPHKEALYECSSCGRLICEDCMVFDEDDNEIYCPGCHVETAAEIAARDDLSYQVQASRKAGRGRSRTGEQKPARFFNPLWLLLFVILSASTYGLSWYLEAVIPPVNLSHQEFQRLGNPAMEMMVLASAIFQYQARHDGRFPKNLDDLFPDYIDRSPTVLRSAVRYDYRLNSQSGFLLTCPQPTKYGFRKLAITGSGLLEIR